VPPSASPCPAAAAAAGCPALPPGVCAARAAAPGERVQWAVVVIGTMYPQGAASWGRARFDAEAPPWAAGASYLRILSTWDVNVPDPLFAEYERQGFEPVLTDWAAFHVNHTGGGGGNVNYQMATSHAGLLRARALGATHAVKVRGDVRIMAPRVFMECVLGVPSTLSFLTKWVGTPRYAVEHLVAGPIDAMIDYFAPPFKDERVDGRFPELYLMEQYSTRRGWGEADGVTHIKFCREVDFFYPRLPLGVYYFDHKGITADSDMAGPYTPYTLAEGDLCLLGRRRRLRARAARAQLD
jgi:hypothetical protein